MIASFVPSKTYEYQLDCPINLHKPLESWLQKGLNELKDENFRLKLSVGKFENSNDSSISFMLLPAGLARLVGKDSKFLKFEIETGVTGQEDLKKFQKFKNFQKKLAKTLTEPKAWNLF